MKHLFNYLKSSYCTAFPQDMEKFELQEPQQLKVIIIALREYNSSTRDTALINEIFDFMEEIIKLSPVHPEEISCKSHYKKKWFKKLFTINAPLTGEHSPLEHWERYFRGNWSDLNLNCSKKECLDSLRTNKEGILDKISKNELISFPVDPYLRNFEVMIREWGNQFNFNPYRYEELLKSIKKNLWHISEEIKKINKPAIVYLFGAGANYGNSANKGFSPERTLPLSKELVEAIRELQKKITDYIDEINAIPEGGLHKADVKPSKSDLLDTLKESDEKIDRVLKNSEKFNSLDVYGKYLYCNSRKKELNDLKIIIDIYFSLIQQVPDVSKKYNPLFYNHQYLNFLVSIGERSHHNNIGTPKEWSVINYPSHVKFLSWNYDNMIEQGYVNITDKKIYDLNNFLNVVGSDMVLHLNGMAGYYGSKKNIFDVDESKTTFLSNINIGKIVQACTIIKNIEQYSSDNKFAVTFAWEEENIKSNIKLKVDNYIESIDDKQFFIVVVGYSFPFFNREVDELIFYKLTESRRLKKVYFQNPHTDGSFLYNNFPSLKEQNVKIEHIKDCGALFIPNEL